MPHTYLPRFILIALLCCSSLFTFSQVAVPAPEWAVELSNAGTMDVADVQPDSNGNIYVATSYTRQYTIPGTNVECPFGHKLSAAILKLGPEGSTQWGFPIVANGQVWIHDIHLTRDGALLITGSNGGKTYFGEAGKKPRNHELPDDSYFRGGSAFVARYSAEGALEWVQEVEAHWAVGHSLAESSDGTIFLSLYQLGPARVGAQAVASVDIKAKKNGRWSVVRLSAAGEYQETLPIYTEVYRYMQQDAFRVAMGTNDALTVYGVFTEHMRLAEGQELEVGHPSGRDAFVARYNANGSLLWHAAVGGYYEQAISEIALDDGGNCYFVGRYQYEVTTALGTTAPCADPPPERSSQNFFYGKLDNSGTLVFLEKQPSNGSGTHVSPTSIALHKSGNVHIMGGYSGTLDFGRGQDTLAGRYHDGITFTSVWQENQLVALHKPLENEGGWTSGQQLCIVGNTYVVAGLHNKTQQLKLKSGKTQTLNSPDWHRASWVYSATLLEPLAQETQPVVLVDSIILNEDSIIGALPGPTYWDIVDWEQGLLDTLPTGVAVDSTPENWLPTRCYIPDQSLAEPLPCLPTPVREIDAFPGNVLPAPLRPGALATNTAAEPLLKLFPNPTRNRATLQLFGFSGAVEIIITTASGSVISTKTAHLSSSESDVPLDLTGQAAGLYFVTVRQPGVREVIRLSKLD